MNDPIITGRTIAWMIWIIIFAIWLVTLCLAIKSKMVYRKQRRELGKMLIGLKKEMGDKLLARYSDAINEIPSDELLIIYDEMEH